MKYQQSLTFKQKQFVVGILKGKTYTQSYLDSYDTNGIRSTVYPEASRTARLPQVRQAIEEALAANDATPEYAVSQLKKVSDQDINYGAKRMAVVDLLELMGIKR